MNLPLFLFLTDKFLTATKNTSVLINVVKNDNIPMRDPLFFLAKQSKAQPKITNKTVSRTPYWEECLGGFNQAI